MRDVAAIAGVSFKTVSRVVNGEANVSADLTSRVRAAIEQLGYRPDPTASTLRRADGHSGTVATVLEDLANPFSATVHGAVVATLRPRGIVVLSASSEEDPDHERTALLAFLDRRVDGVVLMPTSTDHAWMGSEHLGARHIVTVDRPAPGFPSDAVVADNRGGAAAGTAHLLAAGHRRIAFLGGPPSMYTAGERRAGHRDALAAAGMDRGGAALERVGLRDAAAARAAVVDLLGAGPAAERPTAIFAAQNLLAVGAVRALRELGRHRDVALVGFDDVELADLLDPGLTVVAQSAQDIGRASAEQLLRRLDGDASPPETRVVPTRLVVRGSGEIPPP